MTNEEVASQHAASLEVQIEPSAQAAEMLFMLTTALRCRLFALTTINTTTNAATSNVYGMRFSANLT